VLVSRIVSGELARDLGPDVAEIAEFRLIELLEHAGADLALQEIGSRRHHVVTRPPGEKLGFQRFVGIEGVVLDRDAGFFAERLDHRRFDVVRPVVDVDRARLAPARGLQRRSRQQQRRYET
jgi:hypothetical protein